MSIHLPSPSTAALPVLAGLLRSTEAFHPALLQQVIAQVCPRAQAMTTAGHGRRLASLIANEAWLDAILELLHLECPTWQVRRLMQADGLWHCALSRQPALPLELDDMAEAAHAALEIALLAAIVEALLMTRRTAAASAASGGNRPALPVRQVVENFG